MKQEIIARHLDVKAFAHASGEAAGHDTLSTFDRLMQETKGLGPDRTLNWVVRGELRSDEAGSEQAWLHLTLNVDLPLVCQRCMGPADIAVAVNQSYRFVGSEEEAQAQDDESEEDVLVLSRDFDLVELMEDEVLMALPLVARHEVCPVEVKLEAIDADFDSASVQKQNPFAVLSKLRSDKSH